MRKLALVLAGLLVGAAVSWQVVSAQESPPLTTLCTRPGADVRTPASNGTCPSGYTKVEIPAPVEQEPTFDADLGEILTFRFSADVQVVAPSVIFRPFVVTPDGQVRESLLELDALGIVTQQDAVPDPVFGTWVIGCHVIDAGTGDAIPKMSASVESSRDGDVTALPPVPCLANLAPGFVDNTQASITFGYGPNSVP